MTGARLPTLLAGLPVSTAETDLASPLPAPAAEDLAAATGMVERRRIEYLAGRHCAREALARLGIQGHVLRAGPDRAPIWPDGVVGSITHTGTPADGFCGVAVALRRDLTAIGIDAESDRPLPDGVPASVLTTREQEALARRPLPERARAAALAFSAKESVYKALAPLLGVFIDFPEVEVDIDLQAGRFTAEVRQPGGVVGERTLHGRLLVAPGLLLTAVVIPSTLAAEDGAAP